MKVKEESEKVGLKLNIQKIREIKGIFHVKMGTIKNRNGVDLAEAEDIKKRWQEYTDELYKKRSSWLR